MSKIYIIGDTHIGLGYPNKTDKWLKVHKEYFDEFLIPTLKENVKEGDIIIHLGDLFDNRNVIPINLLNFALDQVEKISKIAPFHIIIGNHDCWSRSSDEINTVRPFKYIPNVFVYDKVTKVEFAGQKLLLMPYIEKKEIQIELIKKNRDCDWLFCHSDLNGAKMHLTSVANKNLDKIDVESFDGFKGVYSGHIHLVQRNKNFLFVGSNFQMDRNDYGDKKGIFCLDLETGKDSFIENTISPKFVKLKILKANDIELLEKIKLSKDYIDISISTNLLINDRKLRRKLEVILESGNFSTIEYIDDIIREDKKEKENIETSDINISIELDYEDYIREYIKSKNWASDSIKNGILNEYENVIEIYKNNYKLNLNENL